MSSILILKLYHLCRPGIILKALSKAFDAYSFLFLPGRSRRKTVSEHEAWPSHWSSFRLFWLLGKTATEGNFLLLNFLFNVKCCISILLIGSVNLGYQLMYHMTLFGNWLHELCSKIKKTSDGGVKLEQFRFREVFNWVSKVISEWAISELLFVSVSKWVLVLNYCKGNEFHLHKNTQLISI